MKNLLLLLLMPLFLLMPLLMSAQALANDTAFNNVRDNVFWTKLYYKKYHTLYCAATRYNTRSRAERVAIERVYPANWIAKANGCRDNNSCSTPAYNQASSDLHHLWPALPEYKKRRGQLPYIEITEITGIAKITDDQNVIIDNSCDFKQTSSGIEPRKWAKGEIARSFLYQVWKYNLPDHNLLPLMVKWANEHPVSTEEKWRNNQIQGVQGNRNPFIDDPALAEIFASIR